MTPSVERNERISELAWPTTDHLGGGLYSGDKNDIGGTGLYSISCINEEFCWKIVILSGCRLGNSCCGCGGGLG